MSRRGAGRSLCAAVLGIAVAGAALLFVPTRGAGDPAGDHVASRFRDPREALDYLLQVAMSPRCINCHGKEVDGRRVPLVGDDMRPHPMNVSCANNPRHDDVGRCEGAGDEPPGLACTSCHGRTNREPREAPPGAYAAKLKPPLPWMMPTRELVILERLIGIRSQAARRVALCTQWLTATKDTARIKKMDPQSISFIAPTTTS